MEYSDALQALENATGRLNELTKMKNQLEDRSKALSDVIAKVSEQRRKQQTGEKLQAQMENADEVLETAQAKQDEAKKRYSEASGKCVSLERELEKLDESWNEVYMPYYVENSNSDAANSNVDEQNLNLDDVNSILKNENANVEKILDMEGEFLGLKELLDKENSDLGDKEALLKTYRNSMDKCVKAIEYRGSSFDEIKAKVDNGEIENFGQSRMYEIKDEINGALASTSAKRGELDSLNAMMNRLAGSIEHGIGKIKENYGEYEKITCANPEEYIRQHKNQADSIAENIKNVKAELAKIDKEQKDIYVWDKDLERIITNAGMTVPSEDEVEKLVRNENSNVTPSEIESDIAGEAFDYKNIDISSYEGVAKDYDRLLKQISRKKDEFEKRRSTLANLLEGFGAGQLADEIRDTLEMPSTGAETLSMAERLNETTGLIALEKERVSKGIADMERIKDNFENRCIQTCCNIKTDLDRLPRLSTIRMGEETISIVGLSIPYVPEDSYKERMSAYIDETVDMAESFPTQDERLRYIRNRLTWKRMFSVIVTDMNSIRVNLYKRERIKDQSRYLRYEEAVGSTGQSQGIYIQFLIAVINYISSINAAGNAGVIGKTIFIDNPFGAAKDIYIWEPIFELLKTNHVQLIVPARGATPAITGRFDVNYVLGQKMTDGRQTTVVVDYYSKTDVSKMEYTRMDYEQTSLFFE
jgi:chromosome segregation ATPase